MRTGTVKFFNESKGFGFITDQETQEDIFVHISGLKSREVRDGDVVNYVESDGKKGKIATEVVVL
ncbi:MAG TPA: cold shock domain-containing protein [Flavobacterium sp.]|nr:cold shock domain-containing protein [Flavobacterium sp.]